MVETIRRLLDEYKTQLKADPATADKTLLTQSRALLEDLLENHLTQGHIPKETVHLANEISYFFGGDKSRTVEALMQYLAQSLDRDEEAWARWQLVDNLAMLRRCEEVVEKQKEFLVWARNHLPPNRLLWVMYDSTQAFCWVEAGHGLSWLNIFEQLISEVFSSSENRYDRFVYLRTANRVYSRLGQLDEAWRTCEEIETLSNEDDSWEKSFAVKLESLICKISLCVELKDYSQQRQLGILATFQLNEYRSLQSAINFEQRRELSSLYHNLAASLYFAKQYDLAIPVLREAIEIGVWEHYCYSWLAASLWATNKNMNEVVPLLQAGSARVAGEYSVWQQLPEFQEISNDTRLLKAAGLLKINEKFL